MKDTAQTAGLSLGFQLQFKYLDCRLAVSRHEVEAGAGEGRDGSGVEGLGEETGAGQEVEHLQLSSVCGCEGPTLSWDDLKGRDTVVGVVRLHTFPGLKVPDLETAVLTGGHC